MDPDVTPGDILLQGSGNAWNLCVSHFKSIVTIVLSWLGWEKRDHAKQDQDPLTKNWRRPPSIFLSVLSSESMLLCTGKSFTEVLILASTNPQYDKILFIDSPVQYMKTTSSEHAVKSQVLSCLVLKPMQAFSDCLWRGYLILIYCDLLTKPLFLN